MKLNEKKFYTTENLFNDIWEKIKKSFPGLTGMVDYAIAESHNSRDLYTYELDTAFILSRGGCEGTYIDLSIRGIIGPECKPEKVPIGTIKSLRSDNEGIRIMSQLYGELIVAFYEVLDEHMDDITRIGNDLRFYRKNEKDPVAYKKCLTICEVSKENVRKKIDEYEKKYGTYDYVIIRDNLTRKFYKVEKGSTKIVPVKTEN